jgi:hypothetical protein
MPIYVSENIIIVSSMKRDEQFAKDYNLQKIILDK